MPTISLGRADHIEVVGDEDGFELHISTDEGEYVVNVHSVSQELLDTVQKEIGEYWATGRALARQHALERRADFEQADAYDLRNPKHPQYHSTHVSIWDEREEK